MLYSLSVLKHTGICKYTGEVLGYCEVQLNISSPFLSVLTNSQTCASITQHSKWMCFLFLFYNKPNTQGEEKASKLQVYYLSKKTAGKDF